MFLSQKPDSLVLGVQRPGVGGCKVQMVKSGNAVSSTREVQTEEKADSWMKKVESSSLLGQDVQQTQHPSCPNTLTSQAVHGEGVCTSSLPSHQSAPGHCQVSNNGRDPQCNKQAAAPSCQPTPEYQGAAVPAVSRASNGVRGKSVGAPGRGSKAGHHHHHHARRLVINLDDKNKFTEEVTV